jgi:hypothetical protein
LSSLKEDNFDDTECDDIIMLFSGKINPGVYFTHRIIEKFFYPAVHILALLATDQ